MRLWYCTVSTAIMYEISTCNDISNISAIQFNPEINNGKYHTTKILSI